MNINQIENQNKNSPKKQMKYSLSSIIPSEYNKYFSFPSINNKQKSKIIKKAKIKTIKSLSDITLNNNINNNKIKLSLHPSKTISLNDNNDLPILPKTETSSVKLLINKNTKKLSAFPNNNSQSPKKYFKAFKSIQNSQKQLKSKINSNQPSKLNIHNIQLISPIKLKLIKKFEIKKTNSNSPNKSNINNNDDNFIRNDKGEIIGNNIHIKNLNVESRNINRGSIFETQLYSKNSQNDINFNNLEFNNSIIKNILKKTLDNPNSFDKVNELTIHNIFFEWITRNFLLNRSCPEEYYDSLVKHNLDLLYKLMLQRDILIKKYNSLRYITNSIKIKIQALIKEEIKKNKNNIIDIIKTIINGDKNEKILANNGNNSKKNIENEKGDDKNKDAKNEEDENKKRKNEEYRNKLRKNLKINKKSKKNSNDSISANDKRKKMIDYSKNSFSKKKTKKKISNVSSKLNNEDDIEEDKLSKSKNNIKDDNTKKHHKTDLFKKIRALLSSQNPNNINGKNIFKKFIRRYSVSNDNIVGNQNLLDILYKLEDSDCIKNLFFNRFKRKNKINKTTKDDLSSIQSSSEYDSSETSSINSSIFKNESENIDITNTNNNNNYESQNIIYNKQNNKISKIKYQRKKLIRKKKHFHKRNSVSFELKNRRDKIINGIKFFSMDDSENDNDSFYSNYSLSYDEEKLLENLLKYSIANSQQKNKNILEKNLQNLSNFPEEEEESDIQNQSHYQKMIYQILVKAQYDSLVKIQKPKFKTTIKRNEIKVNQNTAKHIMNLDTPLKIEDIFKIPKKKPKKKIPPLPKNREIKLENFHEKILPNLFSKVHSPIENDKEKIKENTKPSSPKKQKYIRRYSVFKAFMNKKCYDLYDESYSDDESDISDKKNHKDKNNNKKSEKIRNHRLLKIKDEGKIKEKNIIINDKESDDDDEDNYHKKLEKFFMAIQALKDSDNKQEIDKFITDELEKNDYFEKRLRSLRLNSFMTDIRNYRDSRKIKDKFSYVSPIIFSSPSKNGHSLSSSNSK